MKAVLVQTSGNSASATVIDKTKVNIQDSTELNNVIHEGILEIDNLFSGTGVADPTKKKCSRCFKLGRQAFHDIEDFSLLLNNTRSSQCKVCRSEQSVAWANKRKEHRQAYQAIYKTKRNPVIYTPKAVKIALEHAKAQSMKNSAVIVAYPTMDIEETK